MMTRTFLCPPTFYDVTYSINPYMDPSVKVDRVLAWRQWSRFVDALEKRGLDLLFIEPRDGCPTWYSSATPGWFWAIGSCAAGSAIANASRKPTTTDTR